MADRSRLPLAQLRGVHGGLGAALHAQFRQECGHVVLDRLLGQEQLVADLSVGVAIRGQGEDVPFAVREAGGDRIGFRSDAGAARAACGSGRVEE